MELKLYQTPSADNVLNKTLNEIGVMDIFLKRDVDISSPVLILKTVPAFEYMACNYAEIPALGRFYFIRYIEALGNEIFRLSFECDVLETYRADVLASPAKYMRRIRSGDYGETSLSPTGVVSVTEYESNVTLEPGERAVFNVLRWK